jgi:hypothetical protein
MEHDQDFSALRNILALKKLEMPMDTEVNRFLIEFHRRQRAQLLVPETRWARAMSWLKERAAGFELAPSLSYASAFAAIAIAAFVGLSQQVQVTQSEGGQYKLSFHMPTTSSAFAMIPASFSSATPSTRTDGVNFSPNTTTRFVLANSRVAYDATVAF